MQESNALYGILTVEKNSSFLDYKLHYQDHLKILYLEKDSIVEVDFEEFYCTQPTIFFLNSNCSFTFKNKDCQGKFIYFHPEFYCIQLHDNELACDGLLYNNVLNTAYISLDTTQVQKFHDLIHKIQEELTLQDEWSSEKVKLLLKYIIIEATRHFIKYSPTLDLSIKEQHLYLRKFNQLIEANYRQKHKVSDYASLLNISERTLHKRIKAASNLPPSKLISTRIILQAKRLLAFTTLSNKEIAIHLGYEDISYFNRFFKKQTSQTPLEFRKNYTSEP